MTPRLSTGRIVWAEIADSNGYSKLRPAVIVTPTDRLSSGAIDVVAVTSRLEDPLPENYVLLPWHAQGHPRTRLNRKCAAVCSWMAQISESDIQDTAGVVPAPLMQTILAKIAANIPREVPGSPDDSPS